VIVQRTVSVRDIEAMVTRVKLCYKGVSGSETGNAVVLGGLTVEEVVHVHRTMKKVLPCIDNGDGN
jgi:hypothetical protein